MPHPPAGRSRDRGRIAATDEHVAGIQAEAHVRSREQPRDIPRMLDDGADMRMHDDGELRGARDGLDERQRLEQRHPFGVGELGPRLISVATGRGREHEQVRPKGPQGVRLLFDRRELGGAPRWIVEHRRDEAADATEAVAIERARRGTRVGRKEARRARLDRAEAEPRGIGEDTIGRELHAPVRHFAHAP